MDVLAHASKCKEITLHPGPEHAAILFFFPAPELCPDAVLHAVTLPVRLHSASGHLHLQRLPQAHHTDLQPHCKYTHVQNTAQSDQSPEAHCCSSCISVIWIRLGDRGGSSRCAFVCVCAYTQRKVPDQDVAQGSYIALPLTLLLLLAAYNHEKVHMHFPHPDSMFGWSKAEHPTSCDVCLLLSLLTYRVSPNIRQGLYSFSLHLTHRADFQRFHTTIYIYSKFYSKRFHETRACLSSTVVDAPSMLLV